MDSDNRGARALRKLLEAKKQADLAKATGAHQSLISRWCDGSRVPSGRWRVKLLAACSIPFEDWDVELSEPKPRESKRKRVA